MKLTLIEILASLIACVVAVICIRLSICLPGYKVHRKRKVKQGQVRSMIIFGSGDYWFLLTVRLCWVSQWLILSLLFYCSRWAHDWDDHAFAEIVSDQIRTCRLHSCWGEACLLISANQNIFIVFCFERFCFVFCVSSQSDQTSRSKVDTSNVSK